MKPRTALVLVLAVICAASAAVGVNSLLNQFQAKATVETTMIAVAARNVPRGGVLAKEAVVLRPWPANMVPDGVLTDLEAIENRTVAVPLTKGEPVLTGKLVSGDVSGGLAGMISPGMRAFTIRTPNSDSGVGGFVLPGNRVDVLLTTTSSGMNDGTGGAVTTTLLQNVQVMAVDRYLDAPEGEAVNSREFKTVTLLVNPDQAAKLSLAANRGMLNLTLRHPDDNREADARPATLADLRFYHGPLSTTQPVMVSKKVAGAMFAALAAVAAGSSATAPAAEVEQEAEIVAQSRRQVSHIQTLRGVHLGSIRVEN